MPVASIDTWLGRLSIYEDQGQITRVDWTGPDCDDTSEVLDNACQQISEYLDGARNSFSLPLAPRGSAFYQSVFRAMLDVPYGQTRTYGQLAEKLGTYGQPVGQACGANPIPIIIPCHRILSAEGLGGYSGAGGVETKIALLKLEKGYPFLL
ncbi:methylated-DNA--[protein]-cysteine S-methyltransferase [Roseibium denhamense]|uniref:Methylated-DNA--protein-cysteine methyltransferase n=1 Tax=Roseibium denhamense TaxID=76305 RepID=A0ABY1NL50_9HYPH|nr:methylated-DNA--[protein]-cysteine S-methyltransferase [Roseibium denhamense]MTI06882.1 methylated-DNA--[protein]-cysteine S-methyltransferase [Roseibium denhamense]SMP12336.1 methylated-DNA-[protein]-cysteine S-methyltransferase [Roseibium denhamense]